MGREWALYDRLFDELSADATVRACMIGRGWTLVESEAVGMAMTFADGAEESRLRPPLGGRSLRELAGYLTSWNLAEASLGLAAVNAHFNAPARIEAWLGHPLRRFQSKPVFEAMESELAGKRVAVIGHFPGLERLAERCDLAVFERCPQPGDLPDVAEDYLLPHQEYVFVTGTTLTNKTLPHLLELCRQVRVVLVGPSVPLTPLWFEWGVHMLAGAVVVKPRKLWQIVEEGGILEVFDNGAVMVQVRADDLPSSRST